MPERIYIAIVNNGTADKTEVVYAGKNLIKSKNALWDVYQRWLKKETPDIFYRPYKDIHCFINAASSAKPAYIQFFGYRVNFELHAYKTK